MNRSKLITSSIAKKSLVVVITLALLIAMIMGLTACGGGIADDISKITFEMGGIAFDGTLVRAGEGRYTKPITDPTKEGYTFDGWYLDEACTDAAFDGFGYLKTKAIEQSTKGEAVKIYPKWKSNQTEVGAKFAVNVDPAIIFGAVTVDKTTAAKGELIKMTVTAAKGFVYEFKDISVMQGATKIMVIGDGGDNYHFTMPEGAVTIAATFTAVGSKGLSITYDNAKGYYQIAGIGTCTDKDIIVPATFDDGTNGLKDIKAIGANAFKGNTSIASITMPDIVAIGESAFSSCTSLKSFSAPKLSTIGSSAFMSSALTTLELNKVDIVEASAFKDCAKLTSVKLFEATEIKEDAFSGCSVLVSAATDKVKTVGASAFSGCAKLLSAKLPFATTIGESAFLDCKALALVTIPKITEIKDSTFSGCVALNPNQVFLAQLTKIGNNAFASCSLFTSLILPNVTTVGNEAFKDCASLESIALANVATIRDEAFQGCKSKIKVFVKDGAAIGSVKNSDIMTYRQSSIAPTDGAAPIIEGVEAQWWHMNDGVPTPWKQLEYTLENGVYSVTGRGTYALNEGNNDVLVFETYYGTSATSAAVTSIKRYSTEDGATFKTITMPTVTTIDESAFEGDKLSSIVAPILTTVEASAFNGCVNLKEVSANSLKAVGNKGFNGCSQLTTINLSSVTTIGNSGFMNCSRLSNVFLPIVKAIYASAFANCTALKDVQMPVVTLVGAAAFGGCTQLEKVYINSPADETMISNNWLGTVKSDCKVFRKSETAPVSYSEPLKGVRTHGWWNFENETVKTWGELAYEYNNSLSKYVVSGIGQYTSADLQITVYTHFNDGTNEEQEVAKINEEVFIAKAGFTPNFTSVILANVTEVGANAFAGCSKLTTIDLSKVTKIGNGAFGEVKKVACAITSVDLASVDSLGESAFAGCSKLATVSNYKLSTVPAYAFSGTAITSFAFSAITSIGEAAFKNCAELSGSVDLRAVVTNVGLASSIFEGCTKISGVQIANAITAIPSNMFNKCALLTSFALTNIDSIGDFAFAESGVTSAKFKVNATIGNSAFRHSKLGTATFAAGNKLGESAFEGTQLTSVDLTALGDTGSTTLPKNIFQNCLLITTVKLGSITSVGENSFSGCSKLTSVKATLIADAALTEVGDGAFSGCAALKSIKFPKATTIGQMAFYGAGLTAIESADLPLVESVGKSAFAACAALARVNMPKLTTIGETAFTHCAALKNVTLPAVTTINLSAFENCTALASVTLPAATTIGANAFANCTALANVSLTAADGVVIGDSAFSGCNALASVTINNVKAIGMGAFGYVGAETPEVKLQLFVNTFDTAVFAPKWTLGKTPALFEVYVYSDTQPTAGTERPTFGGVTAIGWYHLVGDVPTIWTV